MTNCPIAIVCSANDELRRVIIASLGELGYTTHGARSQVEAFTYASQAPIDVVVFDAGRVDAIGRATIRQHWKSQPQLHILYLVDGGRDIEPEQGIGRTYDAALRKPFHLGDLCDIVSTWLAYRMTLENVTGLSIH